MLESLHLDAADRPVAVLLEGPALKLRRPAMADVFAPLGRLSRVVVHGCRVQWRTEALLACAEAGVPVLWMSGRGRLVGVLFPTAPPAQRRDLAAVLEAAATVPGFRGRLEDFCRAELRRAVLATLKAEGMVGDGLDLRVASLRTAWLGQGGPVPERVLVLWEVLRGCGEAIVAEGLVRQGVGGQFLARRSGGFPLPAMLGEVLVTPLCPTLGRLAVGLAHVPEAEARRAVIRLAEEAQLASARDGLLSRLAIRLAAEV
jgi:hypothetical protein